MNLERFYELGPELEIELHYSIGFGWYGWARISPGGRDITATYNAEMDGADNSDDFDGFVDQLYLRLHKLVTAGQ